MRASSKNSFRAWAGLPALAERFALEPRGDTESIEKRSGPVVAGFESGEAQVDADGSARVENRPTCAFGGEVPEGRGLAPPSRPDHEQTHPLVAQELLQTAFRGKRSLFAFLRKRDVGERRSAPDHGRNVALARLTRGQRLAALHVLRPPDAGAGVVFPIDDLEVQALRLCVVAVVAVEELANF